MKIQTPFRESDKLLVVEARAWGPNGKLPLRLALDTGAVSTTLRPRVMDVLGYNVRDALTASSTTRFALWRGASSRSASPREAEILYARVSPPARCGAEPQTKKAVDAVWIPVVSDRISDSRVFAISSRRRSLTDRSSGSRWRHGCSGQARAG
jgi:hypothetical protein